MGLLDRLFGRRGGRGSGGGRWTRDDSPQYVQPLPVDQSGGQAESHHHGSQEAGGQQDPGQGPQDPGSQNGDGGGGDGGGGGGGD